MPILEVNNLSKRYGPAEVLKSATLTLDKGEVVSVIGASGSGKTTLLRCIALLERFDSGEVKIDNFKATSGTQESERSLFRKKIGVVFQDFHLWPHKTVLQNVTESLGAVKGMAVDKAEKTAEEWLSKVDLLDKRDEYPENLSGGQKQRVAIARTLAMEPEIVLLDEITAALDPVLASGVLKIIKRLAKDGTTMLVVTHHMSFAREISDRVIFMDKGMIIEQDVPEVIFEKPQKEITREFMSNILDKKQEINVYEGYDDFQAYHLGLLKRVNQGSVGYVVGAAGSRWFECMGRFYAEYEKLIRAKNITWKWISYKIDPTERDIMERLGGHLQVRIIPKEYATPSNFNIWEDALVLQTFGEPPAVIEVRNKDLVSGYINYFNLLWEIGTPVS